MATKFNKHFFDEIDTEEKAYWLGFLWCDGYLGIRDRPNRRLEYNLKLDLSVIDKNHVEKLNKSLEGEYVVKEYSQIGFGGKLITIARLFITNQHLGKVLSEKYGLIPHREDCSMVWTNVPYELKRHFIRGVVDADGSFSKYITTDKGYTSYKYILTIGTTPQLNDFIEQFLIENGIIDNFIRKKSKRHKEENRDKNYIELKISGKSQFLQTLKFLYQNQSICLERKYEKYLKILEEMKQEELAKLA